LPSSVLSHSYYILKLLVEVVRIELTLTITS
jgi:hypothetical protein